MKIEAYHARDFKGIREIELAIGGRQLVVLAGPNGSGKSSVLDSITAALAGKDASPDMPIRRGARRADVMLDLGPYKVRRVWIEGGESRLTVESADGDRQRSPQKMLDALFGAVAFDPLAFTRWKPEEQARVLRRLAGLEAELAQFDAREKSLYEERTDVNRAVRLDEAALAGMPEAEFAGLPAVVEDPAAILEEYQQAVSERLMVQEIRETAREATRQRVQCERETQRQRGAVEELERKYQAALASLQIALAKEGEARDEERDANEAADGLEEPELEAIQARLDSANRAQTLARRRAERQAVGERIAANRAEAEALTEQLAIVAVEREARLAQATLPVPGLGLNGETVVLRGVPLEQASSAEQLKVGLAVGMALNPRLRVALVRDGSLLDDDSMRLVGEWAATHDYQVWIERVGAAEGDSVHIVAGTAKAIPQAHVQEDSPDNDDLPF